MVEVIRKIKWCATGLDAFVAFFFYISQVFAKAVRRSSPGFTYVDLLTQRAGNAIDDFYGHACKVVSD